MTYSTPPSDNAGRPATPIRAAQYVRMSTEHQKYSTENQADAIRRYAEQRGITIVRSYEDDGKSGLRLDGRASLQRLLEDVRQGHTDFTTILVYDVSRWGRFQDADESAYYEFLCKEAGITVRYCAEQFENDGSLSATIIKSMKRAMAGEYSRELSSKVFAGQCRLISLGYRQGGQAGYGLRRQLIDEHHQPKGLLRLGEHKSLQTDRVVLVPGPQEEIETVRRMYQLFVKERQTEREIADVLNTEGIRTPTDRPWSRGTVHEVLTNEKYIGNNVYNRVSFKLKQQRVVNPPDMWVRADRAFEPLIDLGLFDVAQQIIASRSARLTDWDMLERLRALLNRKGWLSGLIIDECEDMPSSSGYRTRFGSLSRAYQLVGYTPSRDAGYLEVNARIRTMHPDIVDQTLAAIRHGGGMASSLPNRPGLWLINDEVRLSLTIARCMARPSGTSRWTIRLDAGLAPDLTLAVRLDSANTAVLDYYLFPHVEFPGITLRLADSNGLDLDAFRFDTLDVFHDLTARTPLREAA